MSQHVDNSKDEKHVETLEVSATKNAEPVEKAGLGQFFRIFSYSTNADRIYLLIGSLSSVGAGVALPLMNIVFGNLVGSFTDYFIPGSDVTLQEFRHGVNRNALFIVYLFIGKFVLSYISMFTYRTVGIRLSATLRLAYLRSLFSQPISVLDKKPAGEAANTITNSANVIQVGISEKLSIFIQSTAMVISSYAIAFRYSWLLTLVSSTVFLFIGTVYGLLVPALIKGQRSIDQADEKSSSIASEVFAAVRIVMACGAESRMASRYNKWVEESRRRGLRMSPIHGLHLSPLFFAIYGSYGLSFWFGIKLYHEGRIHSVSNVVIVFSSVMVVITALGGIVSPLIAVAKAASAATGFFNVLDAEIPSTKGLKEPEVSASEDIALNNVAFAYPSRPNSKILNGLNITFEKNKVTAIVGPSGSGKSTIIGLLQRWYELHPDAPSEMISEEDLEKVESEVSCAGSITVGGRNILDLDLKWWRNSTGLVQQEPFVFSDTIFNNIAHGLCGSKWENVDAETKKKLVEGACKEAYADEFIRRLPEGYETQVGESGIKLSGGQRQRIAIARAIIKRPSILLLDEATSSIDVRGERIVQAALDRVSKDRTTITIAHRLSTIKRADKIIVMTKGTVVEQGTHEELLENKNGTYFGLVYAQELMMTDSSSLEIADENIKNPTSLDVEDIAETAEELSKIASQTAPYETKGFIQSFGLLLYEQRHRWTLYVLTIFSAMGCGAAYPLQSFLFAKIVTAFELTGAALIHASEHWGLMFFFLALGVGFMYAILGFFTNTLSVHVSCTYRQEYFDSIIQKPASFFDQKDNSSGTLTAKVANDPVQLQQLLGNNMAMVYVALFQVIGSISVAFAFGWKLTLVALFASMPIIFAAAFYRIQYEIQFERLNAEVFAESSQFASEAIGAYRTVTSLTLEEMIVDRYSALLQRHVSNAFNKARYATLIFAASDSINLLCMALTFWYGGRLLGSHEYSSAQFFVIYVAIIQGSEAAGQWSSFGPNIAQASAAANRILSFRVHGKKEEVITKRDVQSGGVKIEFNNIHFTYPTREIPILRGLNLTIEAGQFAAIVGPSGCGKTTVVSLLERFYNIHRGTILFDGQDISQIPVSTYRSSISLVAQEPTLFQGTIRENVMLGVEPSAVTDAQIHAACADAEIHDFISSLPEGYDTDIGSKGIELSGGQRQRISIARALLRAPNLLLLDEATSSLDSETEKLVQGAFERIGKRHAMTMVVVAHRLATVQNADVIFVLGEGGKLVEKGSHGELLGRRGVYWQMCQAQALDR